MWGKDKIVIMSLLLTVKMADSNDFTEKNREKRYETAMRYVRAILKNANSEDPGDWVGQRITTFDQVYEDHLMSFGYNLRKARRNRGLSIRDLSMLTGIGTGELGALERGQRGFGNTTLTKLSDALGAYACVIWVDKETVHEALQRKPRTKEIKLFEDKDGNLVYQKRLKKDQPETE